MDNWYKVATLADIPPQGGRVVKTRQGDIALFRTADGKVFALRDQCPHKGGPLSQGIVCGNHVTCPLHGWNISLENGQAAAPDVGCARPYPVRVEGEAVYLELV